MSLVLTPLPAIPIIQKGDDLAEILEVAISAAGITLEDGDILAIAQKIVSKAEGRQVRLHDIVPGPRAHELARQTQKDARLIELILSESQRVVRVGPGTIIVQHRLGFVCANAGIDHSNVMERSAPEAEMVLLLPEDPDRSADRLRLRLCARSGRTIGIMIIDSHGRAWRLGTVGVCIGLSGVPALIDERGWKDLFGYTLRSTVVGVADELAAAASLVMGQAAEGTPAIHIKGFPYPLRDGRLQDLIRPREEDLFQ